MEFTKLVLFLATGCDTGTVGHYRFASTINNKLKSEPRRHLAIEKVTHVATG
jgi:hypothetical protein